MRHSIFTVLGFTAVISSVALGANSATTPRPVPLTRPVMKELLEDMKQRKPRIPLPELTAEEKEKLGERGGGYESRLRSLYMPPGTGGFGGGGTRPAGNPADPTKTGKNAPGQTREQDPKNTLDNAFKVELFWIVSRANNCQYCLGHQESKLLAAGLKEEQIAALDCDWSRFSPKEQTAFAFARKFTHEPHLLADSDIESLRKHFTEMQILEMILSMAGNNSINRWKEGTSVPQSQGGGNFGLRGTNPPAAETAPMTHSYLTATPEEFQDKVTLVAPLQIDEKTGKPTTLAVCNRPNLESPEKVEQKLAACQKRTPRLPLVAEAEARQVLGEAWPEKAPQPQWVRLLANFPRDGKSRVAGMVASEEKGDLTPVLKAQVSWIIARQDGAWYAAGLAKKRLLELGQTEEQIYKLDGSWEAFTPADQSLFTVARKLAASPVVLTDEDVENALKLTGPRDVVQLISYTTNRASFDRITEAAGLQLDK